MENNQRYERSLEDELRLIANIQEVKFVFRGEVDSDNHWTRNYFEIEFEEGEIDGAKLVLHTHPHLGVNVSLIPEPFSEKYHFKTEGPIGDPEALDHIRGYVESVREGRAYNLSH